MWSGPVRNLTRPVQRHRNLTLLYLVHLRLAQSSHLACLFTIKRPWTIWLVPIRYTHVRLHLLGGPITAEGLLMPRVVIASGSVPPRQGRLGIFLFRHATLWLLAVCCMRQGLRPPSAVGARMQDHGVREQNLQDTRSCGVHAW